jgi:octaprenyl-diphosphate synthase
MQILSKTTNNIAEGEVLQLLRCKNSQISEKEYYQVIKLKTAYLFKASTQIGAVLSKANKNQELAITNYGMYLGNAFQIMDDLLDYESDYKITGKKIGNDLAEGKATIPIIYALNNTSGVENKFLKDSIENADNSNIEKVVEILHSVKAFDYTRQKTQKFSKLAKECLVNLEESDYKQALILLCDLLLERKS